MILRYITSGIAAAGATRPAEVEKWQTLLYSLVSRQGGGTVVSLAEAPAELARRAGRLGIAGDIPACLAALAKGDAPLLRAEPYDAPLSFGLKHDILADVLARWHDERGGAADATALLRAKRRWYLATMAIMCLALFTAAVSRSFTLAEAEANNIRLKNAYAEQSPTGNYRLSLLLLLANLQATAQSRSWYHYDLLARFTRIHAETERALREFLPRAPWFAGEDQVAALDPDGARLATLLGNTVYVVALPDDAAVQSDPKPHPYHLSPTQPPPAGVFAPWPSVGFIAGLGPAAYIHDTVQFWHDDAAQIRPLVLRALPGTVLPPRVDFIGGQLQIAWMSPGRSVPQHLIRLDADDLRPADGTLAEKLKRELDKIAQAAEERSQGRAKTAQADAPGIPGGGFRPMPVFSEAPGKPQRFAFLAPPRPAGTPGLVLTYEDVLTYDDLQQSAPKLYPIDSLSRSSEPFARFDTTLAFAANADVVGYKPDGPEFFVLEQSLPVKPLHVTIVPNTSLPWTAEPDKETWRLGQATFPFAYPPFALVRIAHHWRAAGLGARGVWVVESSDDKPDLAHIVLGGQLPSGEDRGGLKLEFTPDGAYLLLTQQRQFNTPGTVRVWNLQASWHDWIDPPPGAANEQRRRADMPTLRRLACRIILADGQDATFDASQANLFQIAEPFRQPCQDQQAARN